jgi:segregation and condensation protein B
VIVSMLGPVEALLFAAGSDGLAVEELADALQLSVDETHAVCTELQGDYERHQRGLVIVELGGQWQMVTRADHAGYLRRLATSPTSSNLSNAALEVLAIVAYRQPLSRMDVESVRGVQSDRAIHTLVHRQLITEVGRQEGPGRPILYGTTQTFLQTFGLRGLEDLPPLPEEPDVPQDLSLFHLTPVLPKD